jgi:hypothetical protein
MGPPGMPGLAGYRAGVVALTDMAGELGVDIFWKRARELGPASTDRLLVWM